ncbi:MAG: LysR family transcriptional regulator [Deltaproteobacteria bacterium]|nr:MAG: LysR family transcriptional regulator [Deltaproteobacteria bacterium]
MESTYLKTLREAIHCGSFAKAADRLFITQSAVSRRVKFLEDQLGVELVDRSGPVLQPTEAGKLVLKKAEQILGVEQELMSGLKNLTSRRQVSFCCTPPFAIAHLPGIMQEYMLSKSESVDLKFLIDIPERILAGLKKGIHDFAVMEYCQCFPLDDFHVTELPGDSMVFFARRGSLPENPQLEDLLDKTLFTRVEGCCSRTFLENNLQSKGLSIDSFANVIVFEDLNLIMQSVLRNDGISYLSTDILATCISAEDIVTFDIEGFDTKRKRALIFNAPPESDPLFEDFESLIVKRMGSQTCPLNCC